MVFKIEHQYSAFQLRVTYSYQKIFLPRKKAKITPMNPIRAGKKIEILNGSQWELLTQHPYRGVGLGCPRITRFIKKKCALKIHARLLTWYAVLHHAW